MSQGMSPTHIGGQGYNAFTNPALGRVPPAQPSVAQQLSRLQQSNQTSQQILAPSFQDYFENAAPEQTQKVAQQALEPVRKETQVVSKLNAPQQASQEVAPLKPKATESKNLTTQAYYQELAPLIQDIQQVAKNSGYIDVRAEDVMRAYAQGSSLLADYSV